MNPNPFICLEGLDFVGKTEVGRLLAQKLGFLYYKSPGGCFSEIRNVVDKDIDPLTRFFFYRAATQYDSRQITVHLQTTGVICDRYIYSTIAMHAAMEPRILHMSEVTGLLTPSLTVMLTAREEVRIARRSARKSTEMLEHDLELQREADRIFRSFGHHAIDTSDSSVDQATEAIIVTLLEKGIINHETAPT